MNAIWTLAINYLKNNKKRTYILSICILISTIFITTLLLLIDSYKECMISSVRRDANWEVGYTSITYEEACTIEKYDNAKEISVMYNLGNYGDKKDIYNINSNIIGFDNNAMKNLVRNNIISGRLPENDKEVVCDENSKFEIGDKIEQKLEDGSIKEYEVVGKITGFNLPIYNSNEVITLLNRDILKNNDVVSITILSNDLDKIYSDYFDIYYMLKANRDSSNNNIDNMRIYNKELLEYANVLDYTSEFQQTVYTVEGTFIGIIVFCLAIFIYSIINISIIERKKYFGILKSVGTTTKQMKKSIRLELLIILLITIPLGIFIGILLNIILISIINYLLPNFSTSYTVIYSLFKSDDTLKVAIPLSSITLATLIIVITVYVSSIIPIKKVSRMQAISMIKQNKENINVGKRRKNKNKGYNFKHIERKLAFKNIERYKARYTAIILSLIVSVSLIIVGNYYIDSKTNETYFSNYNYYISVFGYKDINFPEIVIDKINEAGISDKTIAASSTHYEMIVNKENISDAEKDFSQKIYNGDTDLYAHFSPIFANDELKEYLDIYYLGISVMTINEDELKQYLEELGIDKLENDECIFVDYIPEKTKYYDGIHITNYKEGEKIVLKNSIPMYNNLDDTASIKIKRVTEKLPDKLVGEEQAPLIITTKEAMAQLDKQIFEYVEEPIIDYCYISLKVDNIEEADKFVLSLNEEYGDYDIDIFGNEHTSQEELDDYELLRNIFIYCFIGVITLVGLFNMYNAMNANIEVRRREIVSLITIGMEEKQINKMLLVENLLCGILALGLGITIGLSISYLIYYSSLDRYIYNFQIPFKSIVICIIAITLIIIISTIYLKKKISSKSLIDILRKEEV